MQYKKLAELYEQLGSTTKRLEKIDILSKFLKNLHESDRDVLYLLNGNIYPEYDEKKIGISNQLVIKAISKATGISESSVVKEWKFIGDLGKVSDIARKREIDEFEKISLEVGKPIKVMLAQKVNTIKEGFAVVGKPAAIEYKYDGFRL